MARPTVPEISEAESRVMEVLWRHAPRGSEEIAEELHAATGWHENTVRTLLNRLLKKRAVSATRDGRRFLYAPVLARDAWQASESRSLLDRVFGGRVAPLLVHFSHSEKLTAKDVAELRKLVDSLEKKEHRRG